MDFQIRGKDGREIQLSFDPEMVDALLRQICEASDRGGSVH